MSVFDSGVRWKIIKILSESDKTPSEIAEKLKISKPAVHSHIKLLESEGIIKKIGQKKGKTKPYQIYSLGGGFIYLVKGMPKEFFKGAIEIDEDIKAVLNIYSIKQKEFREAVLKFWFDMQLEIKNIKAFAVYGSVARGEARKDSDIDILIITDSAEKFEKKYSARLLKGKMIMSKILSEKDFVNLEKRGSNFIRELKKDIITIYDPKNILKNI